MSKQFIGENRNMEITINLETLIDDCLEELKDTLDDEKLRQEIYDFSKTKRVNSNDERIKDYFRNGLSAHRKKIVEEMVFHMIGQYIRKTGNDDIRMLLK